LLKFAKEDLIPVGKVLLSQGAQEQSGSRALVSEYHESPPQSIEHRSGIEERAVLAVWTANGKQNSFRPFHVAIVVSSAARTFISICTVVLAPHVNLAIASDVDLDART